MKPEKGFTLIELVVVMVIVAVLGAIVFPQVMKSLNRAKVVADVKAAKEIAQSFYLWEIEQNTLLSDIILDNNFHEITGDVINLDANHFIKLSDYISGGTPKPTLNRNYSFYYRFDSVLKVYAGDGTNFWELYPNFDKSYK
ncbi:type II secretion system protein [Caldicellulosiruptor morganii]|uniref:Prepilin-type N-terminal cleavage/methylation domain-containing protein n=1 Tax=Caldicellulosiruptor morganii TaxID=1387555 RepID=A0ABY7BNT7_9FIRM|nr:prepilin-type N-terminal cleavage/methylation domain-containing protein [Caldicellulosiruptor morganii]WAM33201.1 prepilin-type N-terminal cleavage/methylation domain-containing protein [Caldicellulosiruptor morganii]